jgi:hypothetical protein
MTFQIVSMQFLKKCCRAHGCCEELIFNSHSNSDNGSSYLLVNPFSLMTVVRTLCTIFIHFVVFFKRYIGVLAVRLLSKMMMSSDGDWF